MPSSSEIDASLDWEAVSAWLRAIRYYTLERQDDDAVLSEVRTAVYATNWFSDLATVAATRAARQKARGAK